jgi:hypothetical protein
MEVEVSRAHVPAPELGTLSPESDLFLKYKELERQLKFLEIQVRRVLQAMDPQTLSAAPSF